MMKTMLLGTAAALLIAPPASALTMTLIEDDREVRARAEANDTVNTLSENPVSPFAPFNRIVEVGADGYASASAMQVSTIGTNSIQAIGSVRASFSGGPAASNHGPQESGIEVAASASSDLSIIFSIDQSARFSLEGLITSGSEIPSPPFNAASVLFRDVDVEGEDGWIYVDEIGNGTINFDEEGEIEAGNYEFRMGTFTILSGVIPPGGGNNLTAQSLGYAALQNPIDSDGNADFEVQLTLEPIPEPVTASLSMLGLGALALQTSRRRRA